MTLSYLNAVRQGRNGFWRYVGALLVILLFWIILGSIPYAIAVVTQGDTLDRLTAYVLVNLSFVSFLCGLAIALIGIHRRRLLSLVSADCTVRWGRIAQGFGLWLLLMLVTIGVGYALNPQSIEWSFEPQAWLRLLPLALLLTPLQTTVEELFFRGYVMQSLSLLTRQRWLIAVLSAIVFALPHLGNPEVANDPLVLLLFYLSFGLVGALFTLKDNRLELIIGIHAANNLFAALILGYPDSVLDTPTLVRSTEFNPTASLLSFLVLSALSYYIFFGRHADARPRTTDS
ncbi:MAG: CPBP family intramembrane metalloprotease [Kaiparowitsia implicata GSE-PSE-MK54-09C]|jgi:membrane protease YdiL (CAAX protease family)|nr:CPBP family intramembrane metalloprotease [Kaiparowitsia implicata GSE-PSE-MK54-09C]